MPKNSRIQFEIIKHNCLDSSGKKMKKYKKPFAKKSFGQNFLVDENYIEKIISALNLSEKDAVIEIGAGRGALTEKLLESGANVLGIEIEKDMIEVLKGSFAGENNFSLVEANALKVDFKELQKIYFQGKKIKLVANLPYYISTAILQKLIEQREVFSEMVLMFQREVVERITAEIGNSERGFLTILVENYLETKKLFDVPPKAFRPAPKVWSAVVSILPKSEITVSDEKLFRDLVSAAFMQKRKTIQNNLKNFRKDLEIDWQKIFETTQIEPNRRAETLTIEEWCELCENIENVKRD